MISEILNNAEDHGFLNTWYCFGNLFESNPSLSPNDVVGEINLAFMNLGDSIYQGFEKTKLLNNQLYSQMEIMYNKVMLISGFKTFTRENLFTLYALQEGFSRLKYEREDRGTGTIKFISSFLELGDYENSEMKCFPHLSIYSGNTYLRCTPDLKPFDLEGVKYLSLNKNNNLTEPPDLNSLKSLPMKFPGTLLVVKIFLNESHLNFKQANGR